jgi:hypothetical protein
MHITLFNCYSSPSDNREHIQFSLMIPIFTFLI